MNWYTWPRTRDKQGVAIIVLNVRSKSLSVGERRFLLSKYFLPAEAVPDRLPCKRADVPEGELGLVNLTTVVKPCEFLEINKVPPLHYAS